jgi:general secretion pathway protein J
MPFFSKKQGGLTLIELMLALAILAVLGVLAFRGTTQLLQTQAQLAERFERLAQVDRALARLERDLLGLLAPLPRPSGQKSESTFMDRPDTLTVLAPGLEPPISEGLAFLSLLQGSQGGRRVAWLRQGDALHWWRWPHPDPVLWPAGEGLPRENPALALPPENDRMLEGVIGFSVRYAHSQQWAANWPPQGLGDGDIPSAIEITLKLTDFGEIVRIYALR